MGSKITKNINYFLFYFFHFRYKEDRERDRSGRGREREVKRSRSHEYQNRMRTDSAGRREREHAFRDNDKRRSDIETTNDLSRQRDEYNTKYRKRSSKSRSGSHGNDVKRARNQDYVRDSRDNRDYKGRYNNINNNNRTQSRSNARDGFERKRDRSFSPQQQQQQRNNEYNRNRGNFNNRHERYRRDFNDGASNDRSGNNYNRREGYKRDFNDGSNSVRPNNYNNRRQYEQRSNDDRDNYRSNDRQWRDQSRTGGGSNHGGVQRPAWKSPTRNRSPTRNNPFRRNDDNSGGFNNNRKFNNNNRRDFRPGEQRPDRNDERSPISNSRGRSRSHSSNRRENHNNRNRSISPVKRNYPMKRNSDDESYEWGKQSEKDRDRDNDKEETVEKEKPNFGLSGKLTEDTNKVNGVVIKYAEPPEARKPKRRWRLYPFKGDKSLQTLHIHRQSCYLIGRDKKVCDLPVDHPSCSKQHAALQYRLVSQKKDDGTVTKRVRPYVIDLESANGTFLNNKKIDPKKYFELFEKDVLKFGYSSREYVLLHEHSNEDYLDDELAIDDRSIKAEPNVD